VAGTTQHPPTESESDGAPVPTSWLPGPTTPKQVHIPPHALHYWAVSYPGSRRDRDVTWGKCWKASEEFDLYPHRYVLKATFNRIPPDRRDSKGIELLGSIVWYRTKAKIKNISKGGYAKTSPSSPYTNELPQELVEMIIAHVLLDTQTLKACSATCRSWYIVTLPHLHHILTLRQWASDSAHRGLKPLKKLGKMQLLPFVTRLRMVLDHGGPVPVVINVRSPVYFSALLNIRILF